MTDLKIEIKLIDAYHGIYDRMYNYQIAPLVELIRTGAISQPTVKHAEPADYGLSLIESVKMRLCYLYGLKRSREVEYEAIKGQYIRGERPFAHIPLNSLSEQIEKLRKAIYFTRQRLKSGNKYESYDIEQIKKIPITQLTQINANGFFNFNPFRQEKSPSNSLFYYRSTNRWHDFATNKSGDNIDLWMALNNCTLKQALKELSTL